MIFITVAVAIHISMFYLGDITQIKPLFDIKQIKDYVFGIKDLFIALLGIEILTIIPFSKENGKKGVFYSVMVVFFVALFYILISETFLMILGVNDILNYNYSLIEALRETRLPSTILLERVDILFLTVGIFAFISGLSILFFSAVETTSKLFSGVSKNKIFIIIGLITYSISYFFIV